MTHPEAVKAFLKKFPNLIPKQIIDYDDEHYIIEALPEGVEVSYDDPFYGVDKNTGQVTYFSIGPERVKFFDALENRSTKL